MSDGVKKWELDGFGLKIIAIITMFIDHFGAVILERYLDAHYITYSFHTVLSVEASYRGFAILDLCFRSIGRLAFPIFCFFIVEGFFYTSHRAKYAGRLFLFALLSEIPFDLAFHNEVFYWGYQNVYFTLLIGLGSIWLSDFLGQHIRKRSDGAKTEFYVRIVMLCSMGACAALAELLQTDYGAVGVIAIFMMYLIRTRAKENEIKNITYSREMFLGVVILICASWLEAFALIDIWLVHKYNGLRGKNMKYFFYVFYPAHILVLYLVCRGLQI